MSVFEFTPDYSDSFNKKPFTIDELTISDPVEPNRADYRKNDGKFDGIAFFKAKQNYDKFIAENKTKNVVNQVISDGCDQIYGDKKDDTDLLLKFKKPGFVQAECIYANTFIDKFVNNPCNMFIKWIQIDPANPPNAEGEGFKPAQDEETFIEKIKININEQSNKRNIDDEIKHIDVSHFKDIYWKFPFFGGCYLNLNSLLKIQEIYNQKYGTEPVLELIEVDHNIRIGNLRGSRGIGELHAQDNKYPIYNINDNTIVDANLTVPFFQLNVIWAQLEINRFVFYDAQTNKFDTDTDIMNDFVISETDLCPSTITVLENALNDYNDSRINIVRYVIVTYIKNFKLSKADIDDINKNINLFVNISDKSMTLNERRGRVTKTKQIIHEIDKILQKYNIELKERVGTENKYYIGYMDGYNSGDDGNDSGDEYDPADMQNAMGYGGRKRDNKNKKSPTKKRRNKKAMTTNKTKTNKRNNKKKTKKINNKKKTNKRK
jgi:hypothetical protein